MLHTCPRRERPWSPSVNSLPAGVSETLLVVSLSSMYTKSSTYSDLSFMIARGILLLSVTFLKIFSLFCSANEKSFKQSHNRCTVFVTSLSFTNPLSWPHGLNIENLNLIVISHTVFCLLYKEVCIIGCSQSFVFSLELIHVLNESVGWMIQWISVWTYQLDEWFNSMTHS